MSGPFKTMTADCVVRSVIWVPSVVGRFTKQPTFGFAAPVTVWHTVLVQMPAPVRAFF